MIATLAPPTMHDGKVELYIDQDRDIGEGNQTYS